MFKPKSSSVLKSLAGISLLATGTLILSGCGDTQNTNTATQVDTMTTLTTQVSYLDRSMLRPNSQLTVTLADVSKMDVKSTIISQHTVDLKGAPPYTVELSYDSKQIVDRNRYSLNARIENSGKLLYTSTGINNPFADDTQTTPYKVVVSQVKQQPNVPLVNTYWKAITIAGNDVKIASDEPFIQFSNANKVHGFLGCNNFNGHYQVEQQHISFSQLATTQKMCQDSMAQEAAMANVLKNTAQWQVNAESLSLKDSSGKQLATFNAIYF